MKGGKQQGGTTALGSESPQVTLKPHKGPLACWARPRCLSTDTLPSGGKQLGGRGANRSDKSQPRGVGRVDGGS